MVKFYEKVVNSISDFVYPQFCVSCEILLKWEEILYCNSCLNTIEPTNLGNWIESVTTRDHLDDAWTGFWFNTILQDCIHHVKYDNYQKLLSIVSTLSVHHVKQDVEQIEYDEIIPVPLHKVRFRERGFNQSSIIANAMQKELGIPVNENALIRKQWTETQTNLDIQARKLNTYSAFDSNVDCNGRKFLLVDDVLTTGATTDACAAVLKRNGAKRVGIFTLATPRLRQGK